jgi:hypothetical protein
VVEQVQPGRRYRDCAASGPKIACTVTRSRALRSSPTLAITSALPGTTVWANSFSPVMYSSMPTVSTSFMIVCVVVDVTWTSAARLLRAASKSWLLHASTWRGQSRRLAMLDR